MGRRERGLKELMGRIVVGCGPSRQGPRGRSVP